MELRTNEKALMDVGVSYVHAIKNKAERGIDLGGFAWCALLHAVGQIIKTASLRASTLCMRTETSLPVRGDAARSLLFQERLAEKLRACAQPSGGVSCFEKRRAGKYLT